MIVVVGMAFEARIAAGLGVPVICGGDGHNLVTSLARAMAAGCGGLISFGVAGGLAPDLKPGTCVIGSAILDDEGRNAARTRGTGAGHHDVHVGRPGPRDELLDAIEHVITAVAHCLGAQSSRIRAR